MDILRRLDEEEGGWWVGWCGMSGMKGQVKGRGGEGYRDKTTECKGKGGKGNERKVG